jgi:lactoylglutathione lyase
MKMKIISPFFFFLYLTIALSMAFFKPLNAQVGKKPSFNHIAQTVNNLKSAIQFYTEILGLDTIPEPFHDGAHAWFSLGSNTALHLIDKKLLPKGEVFQQNHSKGNHLCISIASVDKQIVVLKKNNIQWFDWPGNVYGITLRPDGVKQIWFQDPDGFWIEVNDAK